MLSQYFTQSTLSALFVSCFSLLSLVVFLLFVPCVPNRKFNTLKSYERLMRELQTADKFDDTPVAVSSTYHCIIRTCCGFMQRTNECQ